MFWILLTTCHDRFQLSLMAPTIFRFSGLELDPANFQLRRAGLPLPLEKIPFELLVLLVERSGTLVTRDEIVQRIWGKDVFLDTENAVSTAVRKARRVLGDDAASPKYIETVPSKGYRFIAPMDPSANVSHSPGTSDASARRATLAVLPLEDLSDDCQDYFSDGMTEEILTHLGRHPRLGVIARTSVMRYKGTRKSINEIGHELGVDYALEGSVRRQSGRVRISVQLIETRGQTHLWAESYEHPLDDVFRLQDRLAREIATQISARLGVSPPSLGPVASPVGREAHEAYLKGRHFFSKRTEPAMLQSIECFEEAIRLEPAFARAHTGIADAYIFLAIQGFRLATDIYPIAERATRTALSYDEELAEAHNSFAQIQTCYYWNREMADALYERAIQRNPSYPLARHFYASDLAAVGRYADAIREMDVARELDPLSVSIQAFSGNVLYRARRYEEAAVRIQSAIHLDPNIPLSYWFLGRVQEQLGLADAPIRSHLEAVRLSREGPIYIAALGHAYGKFGNREPARSMLNKLKELAEVRYVSPLDIALVHLGLGEVDAAMERLEQAYHQRVMRVQELGDAHWDPLRSDPCFLDLLRRVGLPSFPSRES